MANKLLWWHRLECAVHVLYGILTTPWAYMRYTFWRIRLTSHWISTMSITMDSTYVRVISLSLIYRLIIYYIDIYVCVCNALFNLRIIGWQTTLTFFIFFQSYYPYMLSKIYQPFFKIKWWAVSSKNNLICC